MNYDIYPGNLFLKKALLEGDASLKQYDMKNVFLTDEQKVTVEAWYQLPIGVFFFSLFSFLVFSDSLAISKILLYSYSIGIIVALVNWKFLSKWLIFFGHIFGGNISSIIDILFAIYFGLEYQWGLMALAIAASIGLLGFLSPSMWLYSFLSTKMGSIHPKYVFANRYFKISELESN